MRFLIWLLRAIVFVLLFGLAIENSGPVVLRAYFESFWRVPLSLVMLVCFAAGAAIGVSAAFATLVRQRRDLGQLRRELAKAAAPGPDTR